MSDLERDDGSRAPEPKALYAGAAVIAAVAAVGFVTGTSSEPPPAAPLSDVPMTPRTTEVVPHYAELSGTRRGPNGALYEGAFDRLAGGLPALDAPVALTGDRAAALQARRSRRAFDGAPPTIPHPIDQRGLPPCLSCHDKGAVIGDRIAPAMSHQPLASCTQCHVPDANPVALTGWDTANSFTGMASPGRGTRAWPGAPPTIPHSLAMRERCDSCHGVAGASPIRSTHPWRASCQQCHVPEQSVDPRTAFPTLGASR